MFASAEWIKITADIKFGHLFLPIIISLIVWGIIYLAYYLIFLSVFLADNLILVAVVAWAVGLGCLKLVQYVFTDQMFIYGTDGLTIAIMGTLYIMVVLTDRKKELISLSF